ncbi:disintegrin and metalloproteinase domain-containing protein 2-like [Trichosurus vulpecula]|uniref:disintegrin and metalloproteinase domain-containing protein 2-like n=1 Tax=Trichosurus vulpecula TaxID=9337 RepID=UPI00186B4825|nr:disintegrin and metalloproteinase domain-containing protein 2-like [Trichosurus vulpecula]
MSRVFKDQAAQPLEGSPCPHRYVLSRDHQRPPCFQPAPPFTHTTVAFSDLAEGCAMFPLLLLLSGLLKDLRSHQTFLSITVPLKISSPSSEFLEPKDASYVITVEGKTYTLLLKQKIFLPYDFRIYTYNEEGFLTSLVPFFKNFCFYQGHVADFPKSVVTLNTCSGIRGWLQFENVTYGIEPLESSAGFEHAVYQVRNENTDVFLYAENDMNIKSRKLPYEFQMVNSRLDYLSFFSGYLEMHVVVEKNLYNFMGSDANLVTQKIAMVIGLVSTMYSSLNLTIVLSSLEFWRDKNKISTAGEPDELLERFLKWKESYLVLRRHDVAFLLSYKNRFKYVGATFQGKMCERNYAGGVALYPRTLSLEAFSVIIAQLLGHNMGLTYDDVESCHCSRAVCIMNPEAVRSSGMKVFSTCSMADFKNFVSTKKPECLQNRPQLDPSYRTSTCGNGILEAGEECDCGSDQSCITCCTANCRLKSGAVCAHGECCQNCRFRERGTQCRERADLDCDLPEYCNGSSEFCMPDLHVQDGHHCRSRTAFCYKGKCPDPNAHCREIFGQDSSLGAPECFEELNSKGDRSGNCGRTKNGFRQCRWRNLLCARVMCAYTKTMPFFDTQATVIYVKAKEHLCITLDFPTNDDSKDPMWVRDGMVCGYKQVCLNRHCVDLSALGFDCHIRKCMGRGVCNNLKHCHCEDGWLPPNCTIPTSGLGGSIDSGIHSKSDLFAMSSGYRSKNWGIIIGLPAAVIFTTAVILAIIFFRQGKKCIPQDASSDESFVEDNYSEEAKDNPKI